MKAELPYRQLFVICFSFQVINNQYCTCDKELLLHLYLVNVIYSLPVSCLVHI